MIIITNKHTSHNPPLFASGHYYSKNSFAHPITTFSQIIDKPTVLKSNTGISLLFFRNGNGHIIVNSISYPIKDGMLMCLGSYHYYQLKPTTEPIELIQCNFSYDTFVYMAANPYFKFSEITLNIHPLTSLLMEYDIKRVETLLCKLTKITCKNSKASTQQSSSPKNNDDNDSLLKVGRKEFLLVMKLLGILHKTYNSNIWNHENLTNK